MVIKTWYLNLGSQNPLASRVSEGRQNRILRKVLKTLNWIFILRKISSFILPFDLSIDEQMNKVIFLIKNAIVRLDKLIERHTWSLCIHNRWFKSFFNLQVPTKFVYDFKVKDKDVLSAGALFAVITM